MKQPTRMVLAILLLVSAPLASSDVHAQSNDPIPPAIRAKMDGYVGTWQYEEHIRTTPAGDEETVTGTWTARWIYDSLIEWRGMSSPGNGSIAVVEYEGYDPVHQTYAYWFVSDGSRGYVQDSEWDGNTIRMQQMMIAADGESTQGRCRFPYNEDFTMIVNYTCERLTDGAWWVFRRGTATKISR